MNEVAARMLCHLTSSSRFVRVEISTRLELGVYGLVAARFAPSGLPSRARGANESPLFITASDVMWGNRYIDVN